MLEKNNKMISEIAELVTKVKSELANEINISSIRILEYRKNYCVK